MIAPSWPHPRSTATHPKVVDPCPVAGVFESRAATLEEFLVELQELQVIECRTFGPGAQNSRTIYQPIGAVYIYEDAHLPWNPFTESTWCWWTGDFINYKQVEKAKKYCKCWDTEAPYGESDQERMLYFETFDDCAKWVWMNRREGFSDREHPYLVLTYTADTLTGAYRIFSSIDDIHLDPHNDQRIFDVLGHSLGSNQSLRPLDDATDEMKELAVKLAEGD